MGSKFKYIFQCFVPLSASVKAIEGHKALSLYALGLPPPPKEGAGQFLLLLYSGTTVYQMSPFACCSDTTV